MALPSPDELEAFLLQQEVGTLAGVLLELAQEDEAVRKRLERMRMAGKPARLAAAFRQTLGGWKRASRHLSYQDAAAFGREVERWLAQIERELLPKDPPATLALAQGLIELDATLFARADDSGGAIGGAISAACRLWLKAAARCESPPDEWPARLRQLAGEDAYGARADLLLHASLLLDEAALRQLAAAFQVELEAMVGSARARGERSVPVEVFTLSTSLSLLARALRDPGLSVRAVLAYSPQPNPLQIQHFVREYLEFGRPADALPWLEGHWQAHEGSRLRLLAQALEGVDRAAEAAGIRRQIFEQSLAVHDLHAWLELLPPPQQPPAIAVARELALSHSDPVTAAVLLLDIGEDAASETMMAQAGENLDGSDYARLRPLAVALGSKQRWVGATAAYRALVTSALERGYAKAYPYAARDWIQLEVIARKTTVLAPLPPHEGFVRSMRTAHGRKTSFWQAVEKAGTSVA